MAVGTLAAYSAVGSGKPALAQEKNNLDLTSKSGNQIQSLPVRRFDIPAGPLRDVLPIFEQATQLHIEVSNPAALDVQSQGVSGAYTAEDALKCLLTGTSLAYHFEKDGSVMLHFAAFPAIHWVRLVDEP